MIREYFADGLPDLDDPNHTISFDADTIAAALVNIYQKKYGNGKEIEPTLFEKTKEIFEGAVNKGVKQSSFSIDTAFKHQLTHNMWVFAAFRTHKMQRDIAKYLLNEKGELKPFTKFVKDVTPYIKHTNRLWLETEYNTAVHRAHQAADWQRFVDERDVLPNLEWQPSTSTNPGEDHKPYWFTCLPIAHKFWKQHRPRNRWNCKCSLRNTDKEPTPVPADTIIKGSEPQRGLESNPGEKGEIFSNSHPYYPENCGKCPFNKGVGKLIDLATGRKSNCNNGCRKIDKAINQSFIEERRKEYEQYKNDPDYLDVDFDEETGGLKATHKLHNFDKIGGEYEKDVQKAGYNAGHSVIFTSEKGKPDGEKYTEGIWDGLTFEIGSSCGTGKGNIKGILKHCKKKDAEIAVINFPDKTIFSMERLINGIALYNGQTEYRFKHIIYIVDNRVYYYY